MNSSLHAHLEIPMPSAIARDGRGCRACRLDARESRKLVAGYGRRLQDDRIDTGVLEAQRPR
jgi:hypothetical protein